MLKWISQWWTYRPYDKNGKLKYLLDRSPDPHAFNNIPASPEIIEWTLIAICESFDIDLNQRYCLQPSDNLGDIYRAKTAYRMCDDLEFERLFLAIGDIVGEFEPDDLTQSIDVTVQQVAEFLQQQHFRSFNT